MVRMARNYPCLRSLFRNDYATGRTTLVLIQSNLSRPLRGGDSKTKTTNEREKNMSFHMRWDTRIPPRECFRALPKRWMSKVQQSWVNGDTGRFRPVMSMRNVPASPYFKSTTSPLQEDFYYEHSKLSKIQASKTRVGKTQVSARFSTRLVGPSFPAQLSAGSSLVG